MDDFNKILMLIGKFQEFRKRFIMLIVKIIKSLGILVECS